MTDVEVLSSGSVELATNMTRWFIFRYRRDGWLTTRNAVKRTLMPSLEKHGGTAELSSSASLRRTGNFSTADMGMSPR